MVDMPQNPTKPNPIYLIYMYKEDLALNNLQRLICHKTKPIHLSNKHESNFRLMRFSKYMFCNILVHANL